jgi:tetratricopeptide (TPR) repeat protein
MEQTERQAYLELIQALLDCPSGEEQQILAAQPELVNGNLVETMLAVVETLEQRNDEAADSTVDWLRNCATELAEQLGLDINNSSNERLRCLMSLLRSTSTSGGDPEIVFPLLQENLGLLDAEMIQIFRDWVQQKFTEIEGENREPIARDIGNFGNLIGHFPLGDYAINIEFSLACYEVLQTVFTRDYDPTTWAIMQNNFGNAYRRRMAGDRAENLEQAITYYQSALEVHTQTDSPQNWAMTQHNLGDAYNERIQGDRPENIEIAIGRAQAALEVFTLEDFPVNWAMVQNTLGNLYGARSLGDSPEETLRERSENLERSILHFESTLAVYTLEETPPDWAMAQNQLATAYLDRISGDREANIEMAIDCCHCALDVYTRAEYPWDWAITQTNLANAYANRIAGDKAENTAKAQAYQAAAEEVQTPTDNLDP